MSTGYPYRNKKWIISADGHVLISEHYRKHSHDKYGAPNFEEPEVPFDTKERWCEFYEERIAEGMSADAASKQADNDLANAIADAIDAALEQRRIRE